MNVIYEPHPVTPERKAELRKQGLKIIDARFEPGRILYDGISSIPPKEHTFPLDPQTRVGTNSAELAKPARKPRAK